MPMARSIFEKALKSYLHRQPFQPFLIEFDDGRQWPVEKPERVSYYTGDSALYNIPDGLFEFVDCDAVNRFVELATQPPG